MNKWIKILPLVEAGMIRILDNCPTLLLGEGVNDASITNWIYAEKLDLIPDKEYILALETSESIHDIVVFDQSDHCVDLYGQLEEYLLLQG